MKQKKEKNETEQIKQQLKQNIIKTTKNKENITKKINIENKTEKKKENGTK